MRRMIDFECAGCRLAATLDDASGTTGLLWVSGGNEIRCGAYGGQAALAAQFAARGYPVFRYDRRGIGDSEGINGGFENSAEDIAAAVGAFRANAPQITRLVAFGNCDAASALALFHPNLPIDALILANPWVIEGPEGGDGPTQPSSAAVRSRYWARIKNPRSIVDLFSGKIDLRKLAGGLVRAARKDTPSGLSARLAAALAATKVPVRILLARRDTTALAFAGAWHDTSFGSVRNKANVGLEQVDSASHSFADAASQAWLVEQIAGQLSEGSPPSVR